MIMIISACSHEDNLALYSDNCIDCVEYQYQQAYNNDFIPLILASNTYCVGDSAWLMPDGHFWTQIDDELLNIMIESGNCMFLELENDSLID